MFEMRLIYELDFPADIGRASFANPWDGSRLCQPLEWEPASPATPTRQLELATPTCRLMKRPTVQHGGARMERDNRMGNSHTDVYIINM